MPDLELHVRDILTVHGATYEIVRVNKASVRARGRGGRVVSFTLSHLRASGAQIAPPLAPPHQWAEWPPEA